MQAGCPLHAGQKEDGTVAAVPSDKVYLDYVSKADRWLSFCIRLYVFDFCATICGHICRFVRRFHVVTTVVRLRFITILWVIIVSNIIMLITEVIIHYFI